MTPRQLANLISKKLKSKPQGFTIDVSTGDEPEPGYFAIGGNVQPYGHFGALYYSPGTTIEQAELLQIIEANWATIQTAGYVGAWLDGQGTSCDLFIDSTYIVRCDCGTDFTAARGGAEWLGRKNQQIAIGHVCNSLKDNYETIRL
jgi:hypothetical protein